MSKDKYWICLGCLCPNDYSQVACSECGTSQPPPEPLDEE